MLQVLFLCLTLGLIIAVCMCRHFASTKEFNPLFFEDKELMEAEYRNVKQIINSSPISMKHKISYVLDWLLAILLFGGICFVVWMVVNSL